MTCRRVNKLADSLIIKLLQLNVLFKSECFTENSVLPQHSWVCVQTSTFTAALRGEGPRRVHWIIAVRFICSNCILEKL